MQGPGVASEFPCDPASNGGAEPERRRRCETRLQHDASGPGATDRHVQPRFEHVRRARDDRMPGDEEAPELHAHPDDGVHPPPGRAPNASPTRSVFSGTPTEKGSVLSGPASAVATSSSKSIGAPVLEHAAEAVAETLLDAEAEHEIPRRAVGRPDPDFEVAGWGTPRAARIVPVTMARLANGG